MPFNGTGTFAPDTVYGNETPPIDIDLLDDTLTDLAEGLSNCLTRDNQGKPSAHTDWNAKKITNLADAAAATDALNRQSGDARYPVVAAGDFTATMTAGFSGATTVSMAYIKHGNVATVYAKATLSSTSNATSFQSDAIPAAVRPTRTVRLPLVLYDNSIEVSGAVEIATSGVMTFQRFTGGVISNWTASGAKGWNVAISMTYPLT